MHLRHTGHALQGDYRVSLGVERKISQAVRVSHSFWTITTTIGSPLNPLTSQQPDGFTRDVGLVVDR